VIRIGPAGWSYADWEGVVYPRPKPRQFHALAYLADYFDCIEVNSSFYAMPRAEHARRWVELVEDRPDFRFLSKLNGAFTHGPGLDERAHAAAVGAFRAGIEPLATSGKLAALLIQFPVTFRAGAAQVERLERLFDAFSSYPLALELRHASWFEEEHYASLRARKVSLLHIDLPAARDHPPEDVPATGPLEYLRLHGRNRATWFASGVGRDARYDYLYAPDELDQLVARAKRLAGRSDEVYVVTNNHFEGQAIANGLELRAALDAGPVAVPEPLLERFPHLARIAKPHGQQRMF